MGTSRGINGCPVLTLVVYYSYNLLRTIHSTDFSFSAYTRRKTSYLWVNWTYRFLSWIKTGFCSSWCLAILSPLAGLNLQTHASFTTSTILIVASKNTRSLSHRFFISGYACRSAGSESFESVQMAKPAIQIIIASSLFKIILFIFSRTHYLSDLFHG